jgi:putative transposase
MTTYFQNKFRNETTRLQNWDYRWDGSYFITICTKNREHFFGEISNGKMNLSNIGVLADIFWYEIKNHSKNIKLDTFVVMPNHIHAIITLNGGYIDDEKMMMNSGEISVGNSVGNSVVGTGHALSLQPNYQNPQNQMQPQQQSKTQSIGQNRYQNIGKNSVSSIIGSYKSAVTKHARRLGYEFEWQRLYYDHLIQNEHSYNQISNYINNNVKKWEEDRFYGE